jgi:hypothetical protein
MQEESQEAIVPTSVAGIRDLRLDLFRGIGLWVIFLDHIPFNVVSWITIRNYGFSDAAEMFVFISGYTAGFVYGPAMREGEARAIVAAGRLLKRSWQLYVTHILLVVIFLVEIAYIGGKFDNPLFVEEFNVFGFLRHPDVILPNALVLRFRPPGMDVLPLYIVLVLACPAILWALVRRPGWTLLGSGLLYVMARKFDLNFPSFPGGQWYFNPFAWQLLFAFGVWCAIGGAEKLGSLIRSPAIRAAAAAYLLFAFLIVMTWHVPQWAQFVPKWLTHFIYPIDKSNLHILRFIHFLALAVITIQFVPRDWRPLQQPVLQPIILCGQHSLALFCFGIFLSLAGHIILVEGSNTIPVQLLVSATGLVIMSAAAWLMTRYEAAEGRGPGAGDFAAQESPADIPSDPLLPSPS